MAGALIPLGLSVLADLVAKFVDKIFPPKSGATKLPVGTEILGALQNGLATATGTPAAGADTAALTAALQASVTKLNGQGVLKGAATVIDPNVLAGALPSDIMAALAVFMKAVGK